MPRNTRTKTHGLRRQDFPTVYHYRAAIQRVKLPSIWSPRGWEEIDVPPEDAVSPHAIFA